MKPEARWLNKVTTAERQKWEGQEESDNQAIVGLKKKLESANNGEAKKLLAKEIGELKKT